MSVIATSDRLGTYIEWSNGQRAVVAAVFEDGYFVLRQSYNGVAEYAACLDASTEDEEIWSFIDDVTPGPWVHSVQIAYADIASHRYLAKRFGG